MQLKLFTGRETRSMRVDSKKSRTKAKSELNLTNAWNLWSTTTDAEKDMALLFLDIRNFTPLVESYFAGDVIHMIKKLFAGFQTIVQLHHGRIIETTGDGFYAAFGLDQNLKEASINAVKCGQAILKSLDVRNDTLFGSGIQQRLEVGIGVHAGKVATGYINLGNEKHMMVMGYPVNVASRIQSATKNLNNSFLISDNVFRLLDQQSERGCSYVNLKGIKEPLAVYLMGSPYVSTQ